MTLIEGIGDEVTHFFIGLLVVVVASLAWWTTSISEQRHVQTVFLLDRRRHRAHRRLTNHTHTVTIAEGTLVTASISSEASPTETDSSESIAEASTTTNSAAEDVTLPEHQQAGEEEQISIIERMDADSCVVRQRRLAFYERSTNGEHGENSSITGAANSGTQATSNFEVTMEHNYAERATNPTHLGEPESQENHKCGNVEERKKTADDITIKLKYINDDLKLVDGKLSEPIGNFKKRHFQDEIASNKLVRLIFNGQVLHQDSKTLEGCGLFDNCVVHCLVHQKRPGPGEENVSTSTEESTTTHNRNPSASNNNNNQGRDWDLGNFLFAVISFTLLSAWYFRYVYAHLYTVTATVGLILMTGVFTIVIIGFYFPETEAIPRHIETTPRAQSS